MYYRLKECFALRGWDQMNAVLVKRPINQIRVLEPDVFNVLMLCDGETNFSSLPISAEENEVIARYIEEDILEATDEPKPIQPDQRYRLYPNRFILTAFWSITGRCNFRCRHCYMDAPEGMLGEMSHEDAIALIDQMADCGILKVDITGGEPLIRKDFWQLIDHMMLHKINVNMVYTNGWLVNDAVLDGFEQRGMKPTFSISFDGVGWHDWMRGITGAEKAALDALALCKRRGFPMNVQMCLHRGNIGSLRESIRKLAEIGVRFMKCSNVSLTPLWEQNSEGNALTFQEYLDALLDYLPQFFQDGMPMSLILCDFAILTAGSTEYEVVAEKKDGTEGCLDCHLCGSARASCYISPEGRMLPCMPMTACEGQLTFPRFQDVGLREGLSNGVYMQFVDRRLRDLLAVNEKCNACAHKLVCAGGCRAAALEQSGDLMGADLHQCFLWENGYVEKIHRVADEAIAKFCKKEGKKDED